MPSTRLTPQSIAALVASAVGDARRSRLRWGLAVVVVACFADPAAAQSIPETPTRPVLGPILSFVVALILNLVLGALVIGVAPDYSRAIVDRIRSQPVESFLYGILTYVAVFVAMVLLVISVVGIIVLIPGAVVLAVVSLAANMLAVVALGSLVAESAGGSSLLPSLVVGAVVISLLGVVPVVGELANFVLGTIGMGAVAGRYWHGPTR